MSCLTHSARTLRLEAREGQTETGQCVLHFLFVWGGAMFRVENVRAPTRGCMDARVEARVEAAAQSGFP